MKVIKVCIDPHTNEFHSLCDRSETDPCCMCGGVGIVIKKKKIESMIRSLKTSGQNTKQEVIDNLSEYLK